MTIRQGTPGGRVIKFGNYDWIPGYYKDQDVFILGGGPSLMGFDFNRLKGRRKIAICHTVLFAPMEHLDMLVFLDSDPLPALSPKIEFHTAIFKTVVSGNVPLEPMGQVAVVNFSKRVSTHPSQGCFSWISSGVFAVNIALIASARNIYLLGHDGGYAQTHFYDVKAVKKQLPREPDVYDKMIPHYEHFRNKKNIFNCSPISKIKCFPFRNINEIL